MHMVARTFVRTAIVVITLALSYSASYAQESTPITCPCTQTRLRFLDTGKADRRLGRCTITVGGKRRRDGLRTHGIRPRRTGHIDTGATGVGKFQTIFKFDLGKLAGWETWFTEVRTETRFGGPLLLGTGSLNPVNTTALIPAAEGNVFAISALNITKRVIPDQSEGREPDCRLPGAIQHGGPD